MIKGSSLFNKPIVTYSDGERIERVRDIIFDVRTNRVLGFLVDEGGLFASARALPFNRIRSIGADAITVDSSDAIIAADQDKAINAILEEYQPVRGLQVMTEDGKDLGTIANLFFNESSGDIEGYEVTGGIFADAYNGRPFLPAPKTVKIGKDVVFVPADTEELLRMQPGGLKETGQQVASSAKTKAQEFSGRAQSAWETEQPGMQSELQGFWQSVKEMASNASDRASQAVEEQRVKGAVGRPVTRVIFDREDQVILNTGDLITHESIERAREAGVLDVLLNSVYTEKPNLSKEDMRLRR